MSSSPRSNPNPNPPLHLSDTIDDDSKTHEEHQQHINNSQTDNDDSQAPTPIAIASSLNDSYIFIPRKQDIITNKNNEFKIEFDTMDSNDDEKSLKQQKQQIREECVNLYCKDYKFCPCVRRLIIVLCSYQYYIASIYWIQEPVSQFVTYKIYEYDEILSDFQHIQRFHNNNENPKDNMFIYFENMILNKCGKENMCNSKCASFQRHNRDKSKPIPNLKLYYVSEDNKNDNDEISNEKQLELEMDRMHVYLFHSVLKYKNPISSDDIVTDYEYKNIFNIQNDSNEELQILQNEREIRLKSYEFMTRIRSKHKGTIVNINNIIINKTEKENEENESDINTFHGKDRIEIQNIVNKSKTSSELYNNLENKIGQFVWQRIKSVEGVQNLYNVCARYDNIKDEVLHCPFEIITIYDWNDTLRKSKKIKNSWIGQSIRTHSEEKNGYISEYDQITNETISCYKWEKNEAISLKEIIAIKLYTDFDKLQHELKKCFRIITNIDHKYNDNKLFEMRRRLSSYSNWRQCLTVTIKKFSVSINYKRFYHGVNPLMIIERHNILSRLWGPLSATTSYHVASTFATDKGMIIEMNSEYPQLPLCYAFDASQLSDYPEESERLVGFMYVRVRKIFSKAPILIPTAHINDVFESSNGHLIRLYFFAMRLFLEGIYSMDQFLEKVYIELLTLAIKYRCNVMNNNLNKVENRLLYLQENKYAIKCREMFMLKMCEIMLRPSHHYHVIIDDVSPGLRDLMLRNDKEKDIMSGSDIWNIDFFKIDKLYPNMRGLSLFNKYRFNNYNIKRFLEWLNKTTNNEFILLKFVYFDYSKNNKNNKNKRTEKMFIKLKDLDYKLTQQLKNKGWQLKDKELNGYGYRINLRKINI